MGLSANVRGALLQLAAMGLYATHDAVIKTLGARYPAFQILFFSSLLSFPLISMVLMRDRTHGTLRPNRRRREGVKRITNCNRWMDLKR